jgi:beta-glucanase (GH16 family)
MKKTTLFIILIMTIGLVACSKEGEGVPNGLKPLEAVSDCDVPTLEGGWVCSWADEFDGTAIDEDKWNFEIDGNGGGNNELQYYRRENASIVDGKLVITAKKEAFGGRDYTSARLTTRYKGDWRYARIVVSAKMPSGRGMWPAIWMMPTLGVYGTWPNSGEIDIMEYVGYEPDVIHTTIHTAKFNHADGTQIGFDKEVENAETTFKDYEMIWEPGKIVSYVDGVQYGQFAYAAHFNQDVDYDEAFPFDQLFFLILNVAVGGNWGGVQGVDDTAFPTSMEVDYVRVYEKDIATLDKDAPSVPTNLSIASSLSNSIFWTPSSDDTGVDEYEVRIDGERTRFTGLNQIRLSNLTRGQTYSVQVRAVDLAGRVSDWSETLLVTIT